MNCIVTAYYPVKTGKHTKEDYKEWYTNFFNCVTAPIICFCPDELEDEFKRISKENATIIARNFNSFNMMSKEYINKCLEFHNIDPEKGIHSPQLYAVWAAKQEFVLEAIKLVKYDIYTWCDIGCFRNIRPGGFEYLYKYIVPNKITCLKICDIIGAGVLSGDINAWNTFSKLYIDEINKNFHGKEQDIYVRILNDDNATFIYPNDLYGDRWFFLTYIYCNDYNYII